MKTASTAEPISNGAAVTSKRGPSSRVLIITPVRDEVDHVDTLVRGMAAQTCPPAMWVVVDDGSTDGTLERLRALAANVPFMRVCIRAQMADERIISDRLATGSCMRAFNSAVQSLDITTFDFLGKLDGDIELPPDYFERLLSRFELDPGLGIACGDLVESTGTAWKRIPIPSHHVHGALKLYRRECFAAVGPLPEALGWDTFDETYARMRGFRTRSFRDIVAVHHRPIGAHDGLLRGRARHGACAYVSHFPPWWIALRSLKVAAKQPVVLSGFAFVYGYARAAFRRTPRVADDEFRAFVHRELRRRIGAAITMQRSCGRS
jgi:glycosyltransferase involved in cell wall biosynthesis